MEVGSIIRKVNYRDKRPFGGYYQILRIGMNYLYIRFLDGKPGARPMTLSKEDAKYYVAYSHRRVLVHSEKKVVTFEGVYRKVINGQPKIKNNNRKHCRNI